MPKNENAYFLGSLVQYRRSRYSAVKNSSHPFHDEEQRVQMHSEPFHALEYGDEYREDDEPYQHHVEHSAGRRVGAEYHGVELVLPLLVVLHIEEVLLYLPACDSQRRGYGP